MSVVWKVALSMAGAWGPAAESAASDTDVQVASADESPRGEASIRVDVASTIMQNELYPEWIRERNPDLASKFPEMDGVEQWIAVKISGTVYNYQVTITAYRDGVSTVSLDLGTCECATEDLLGRVDEGIKTTLSRLRRRAVEANETSMDPGAVESTGQQDQPRPVLGSMSRIGVAVGGLGAVSLGLGIPLLLREPWSVRQSTRGVLELSSRPPAIAMMAAGGVALVVGVTLVTVDVSRRRRRAATVTPAVGPQMAGLWVSVRR